MKRAKLFKEDFTQICEACGVCESLEKKPGTLCASLSKQAQIKFKYPEKFPQGYGGVRFSSDAMDCAIPIAIDSHSGCSYNCLYCFSNNLQRAFDRNNKLLKVAQENGTLYKEYPLKSLERFLARENKDAESLAMYTMMNQGAPVQLGALGDPFDDLELHSGWAKKAIPLFIKYKQPVRISTKGCTVLQKKEYLKLFEKNPEQFWVAWSIISNSDELISKVDVGAPVTSERLKAMKELTTIGVHCSLRFRPFLPGLSDSYEGEPEAWKKLIERAKAAGAEAISFEHIFLSAVLTPRQKAMYQLMFRAMGSPNFGNWWNSHSNLSETCRRATRSLKYDMTMKVYRTCKELGLRVGISDPHFKELNDTGCCCGMPEEDKWFGKWSRRQMTEVIVQGRKNYENGTPRLFSYEDWKPEWAHMIPLSNMVTAGNWHNFRRKKYKTFGDKIRDKWNDAKAPRGPFLYFGKALIPIGKDVKTGDLIYEYRPWNPEKEKELIYREQK
jgi:DNA repair photolyase